MCGWNIRVVPLLAAALLAGCAATPQKVYTDQQPTAAPARNLTDMDLALGCLDRLLLEKRAEPVFITSTGIPNRAGDKVALNSGLDMLKNSIGQLERSNAFQYVSFESLAQSVYGANAGEMGSRLADPLAIDRWLAFWNNKKIPAMRFKLPQYLISGSISQIDDAVVNRKIQGGVSAEALGGIGGSWDQMNAVLTVDMQVQDFLTLRMINGLVTNKSIRVERSGAGADFNGRLKTAGGYFTLSLDRSEGLHQAVRILIQLGTLELLGRLANVPYEQCLMAGNSSSALHSAYQTFDALSEEERIRYAQEHLATLADAGGSPYYPGPANGVLDAGTRDAVARYQRRAHLVATGQVDLDLYRSLQQPPAAAVQPPAQTAAPRLRINTPQGAAPIFPLNTALSFSVDADRDAHVQCFVQDSQGPIWRVFPSLRQADDRLNAGRTATIPSSADDLRLDTPGGGEIGCIASNQAFPANIAPPPAELGSAPAAAQTLEAFFQQYRTAAGTAPISMESMRFTVK